MLWRHQCVSIVYSEWFELHDSCLEACSIHSILRALMGVMCAYLCTRCSGSSIKDQYCELRPSIRPGVMLVHVHLGGSR